MLLSIILPAYNSEKTLGEAIGSVIAQSSPDWELIVVDDNSSDGTLAIAEACSRRDGRIKVIHNLTNSGPSVARNRAIDIARGEYVGFLDSDDTLHKNFVARMNAVAVASDADVIWCQHMSLSGNNDGGIFVENGVRKNKPLDAQQAIACFFNDTPGVACMWNKIYSRRIFTAPHGLRLNPERVRAEDWEFNLFVFKILNKMVVIDDFLYNYYHRSANSIMAGFRKKDYDLMWRSINLMEDVNEEMNLGKSFKDIINIKGASILEYVYRGAKIMPYKELLVIFKQDRFRTYIDNLEIDKLPLMYKLVAKLLKFKLYRAVFFICRFRQTIVVAD